MPQEACCCRPAACIRSIPKRLYRPDLLAGKTPRTINMSTIGHDLHHADPPIDALIVYNSNPVAVAPQSREVARGFAREDLFTVVLEHFMTDTADYADYVLPATTQLEHVDVHKSYGHLYMLANNAAIEPLGEALPNSEIFRRLAAKMGFDEPCFSETDDRAGGAGVQARRSDGRLRLAALEARAVGSGSMFPRRYAPFAEGALQRRPGGASSTRSRWHGSAWIRCLRTSRRTKAPDDRHAGATLSTGDHLAAGAQLPELDVRQRRQACVRSKASPPSRFIRRDAHARRIVDGARVRIFNDRGSIDVLARVTDRARPGCVVALSIWWKKLARDGKNANELTSQALTDIGRAPTFYDCLVEVQAA